MGLIENILRRLGRENDKKYVPEECPWNRFVEAVCGQWEFQKLTPAQKTAYLYFWYMNAMAEGGHCAWLDWEQEADHRLAAEALQTVAGSAAAENFLRAMESGEQDDWKETDRIYYGLSPNMQECLERYVEEHYEELMK